MPQLRVGIAGWIYPPWRGNLYPTGLPQRLELEFASRRFNALELNGAFYSLQKPASFQAWHDSTPEDFVFALKGNSYVTHINRLKDPKKPLANFFASGLLNLRAKLGPILWQFPPNFKYDADRFARFFDLLPHDTTALARLAREHELAKGRAALDVDAPRPVRHAVEFRNDTFLTPDFIALARRHNVAVVIADASSKFPTTEDVTADWIYARLHGARAGGANGYSPEEIAAWAKRIRTWSAGKEPAKARRIGPAAPNAPRGRDAFVFFDNTEQKKRSPLDALAMAAALGAGPAAAPEQILAELGVTLKPKKVVKKATKKPTKKATSRRRGIA